MPGIDSIIVAVGMNTAAFDAGKTKLLRGAGEINSRLGQIGVGLGAAGIIGFVKHASDMAATLKNVAAQSGATVEQIQEFNYAATQNGASLQDAISSQRRFARRMEGMQKSFEKYGIAVKDASGKTRAYRDVLYDVADRIQSSGSASEKAQIAFELFGDSGFKLVQALDGGSEGLRNLAKEAQETGKIISTSANDAVVEFADSLNRELGSAAGYVTEKMGRMILGIKQASTILGNLSVTGDFGAAVNAAAQQANTPRAAAPLVEMGGMKDILQNILVLEEKRAALRVDETQKIPRLIEHEKNLANVVEQRVNTETANIRERDRQQFEANSTEMAQLEEAISLRQAGLRSSQQELDDARRRLRIEGNTGQARTETARRVRALERDVSDTQNSITAAMARRNQLAAQNAAITDRVVNSERIRQEALNGLGNDENFRRQELAHLEKKVELEEAINRVREQRKRLQESLDAQVQQLQIQKEDRGLYTLKELSTGNPFGVVDQGVAADIYKARQVVALERQAEESRLRFGDFTTANQLFSEADKLRAGISTLRSNERNPFAALEAGIEKTEKAIKELPGMDVVPRMPNNP
jgi:hypothetical protein